MPVIHRLGRPFAALAVALLAATVASAQQIGGPLTVPQPLFPPTNWWNLDISQAPLDPGSGAFINHIGPGTSLHPDFGGEEFPGSVNIYGFPYVTVNANQPKKTVQFLYSDESDGVDHNTDTSFPFYPIPDQAITQPHWIEGGEPGNQDPGGDRHMLLVDVDNNHIYELYALHWNGAGWEGGSGAFWDMNTDDRRPEGWTSADAAGLTILPGLVRYDEVFGPNEIGHAFRFTVSDTNGYVYPASHEAGNTPGALPMGGRLRLKDTTVITGFPPEVQKIFRAMKKYGLIVADNGSDMFISGTFDTGWDNGVLNPAFGSLHASDFEVVELGWTGPTTADVAMTKTDGVTSAVPGQSVVYTISASNAGPGAISGVTVVDNFPAAVTSATWTCSAPYGSNCGLVGSGSGSLNKVVNLAPGGSATLTVNATLDPSATGTLSNTATATIPTGYTDPNTGNNGATDVDTLTPQANLGITKTDGQTSAVPGAPLTYTITATNAGPSSSGSALVADTFAVGLGGVTWSCTASGGSSCGAPSGSGNINQGVTLLPAGTATFQATGTLDPALTGSFANTATIAAPGGVTDPSGANNSATDIDTLTPQADLVMSKDDGSLTAIPGQPVTWTITAASAGPSSAPGATVTDTFPGTITGVNWTCTATPSSSCSAPSGSGNINQSVSLAPGGTATFTATGDLDPGATGTLSNTASVGAPAGVTDLVPANNSDTDTDNLSLAPISELAHGSRQVLSLGAQPGPTATTDWFWIRQEAYSSYEVVVDGASGDVGSGSGPQLDRMAADATTLVQSSVGVGTGRARSLRWENPGSVAVDTEFIRVMSAGCTSDCDAADVYAIRAYDTTCDVARFNNSATQTTVLVIQNTAPNPVGGHVFFRSGSGAVLGSQAFTVAGRATFVLNTATVAAASSGSIRVSHDGRYGDLAGKAVAVEAATGFTFDTPLRPRAR